MLGGRRNRNPARCAGPAVTDEKNGYKSSDAEEMEKGGLLENEVIVQARKREHQGEAVYQPADLLHVHAREGTAMRGGIYLDHTQRADSGQDGQQPPVVVACSRCVFHKKS